MKDAQDVKVIIIIKETAIAADRKVSFIF